MSQPPIENGVLRIGEGRIRELGRGRDLTGEPAEEVIDVGDSIVLPGLINSHCHLDYTNFAGCIPPPKSFTTWIQSLVALKAATSPEEFASGWKRGAEMLVRHGVTTVADVEAFPELLPDQWGSTPLRVFSFREIIALKSPHTAGQMVRTALEDCRRWTQNSDNCAGISPHAPYTTYASLLREAASAARRHQWLLATHVAESNEEFEMFVNRSGPLFEWLSTQRDMSDCGGVSPVQHLWEAGFLGANLLAIHVNYLAPGDAERLGESGSHVVHCPRCHEYFEHRPFPREQLQAAGVNICLGTDSLASIRARRNPAPALDLFAEMRLYAKKHPAVSAVEILKMVTINPARALGKQGFVGALHEGAAADLVVVPYSGRLEGAFGAVLAHQGPVSAAMIRGRWVRSLGTSPQE